MAEIDYERRQLLAEAARPMAKVVVDRAVIVIGVAGLYGLVLVGLSIERVLYFVALFAGIAVLTYGGMRIQTLKEQSHGMICRNRGFTKICMIGGVLVIPFVVRENPYLIHVGTIAGIFALMAVGLNFVAGLAGLIDLGYAAYFAAGAYTSALLATSFGLSFWLTLPLAGLVAASFGFGVAWPCLRVNDKYLALVTLGFGAIVELLARNLRPLTGGTDGVLNIPPPQLGNFSFLDPVTIGSLTVPFQVNFFYLVIALVGLAVLATQRLKNSGTGRSWEAIREDQIAASCFGVNLIKLKLQAFITGSFFAGLAGAVFAHMIAFIHPDNFTFPVSMGVLCMVIAGGIGNVWGVVFGAIFYVVIPERLREFEHLRLLLFGVSLVLLMRFRPQGVFPSIRRRVELPSEQSDAGAARARIRGRSTLETPPVGGAMRGAVAPVILETVGLTKNFGGVQAVNSGDVRVSRGEILGIIGPNGSGKTTFFNLITGLYRPDSGEICYGNPPRSLVGRGPHEIAARGVGRTFQTLRLFPYLTVLENVLVAMTTSLRSGYWQALLRTPNFVLEEQDAVERGLKALSFFGKRLLSMCNEPALSLSYANRRRLEIARVLASEAELVLLDEPAAGMNPSETAELMHDIERIHQTGRTILLIEHDMALVKGVAQRVIAFDHGSKIAEGTFDEVSDNPLVIEAYLGRKHVAAREGLRK